MKTSAKYISKFNVPNLDTFIDQLTHLSKNIQDGAILEL